MSEEKTIYTFQRYRILPRFLFGCLCAIPSVFLFQPLRIRIGIDAIALTVFVLIVLLLFLGGCTIAAFLPLFRTEGRWYIENDTVHIFSSPKSRDYVVENVKELYFSDPLMIGGLLRKKCVFEIHTDQYILSMQAGPMPRNAARKESELWKLFAEIRNRNLQLQRVNDTEGHMIDYWYRKPQPKRPKPVRDERFWR